MRNWQDDETSRGRLAHRTIDDPERSRDTGPGRRGAGRTIRPGLEDSRGIGDLIGRMIYQQAREAIAAGGEAVDKAMGEYIRHLASHFSRIEWSLSFIGVLLYLFVTTTYRIPVGDVAMACALFGLFLLAREGTQSALEYYTGYLIELSLSVDNLFVFILVFQYFGVPAELQPRVLKWGILGALIMRLIMIMAGALLLERFHWIIFIFGGILIYTGFHMFSSKEERIEPERNPIVRLARRVLPFTDTYAGEHFFVRSLRGTIMATPLLLVLLDHALRPGRRWHADEFIALVPGSSYAVTRRGAAGELFDVTAPERVLAGFPAPVDVLPRGYLDADRGGGPELYYGFSSPMHGFWRLDLAAPGTAPRGAHAGSERTQSDLEAMLAADLDGDGTPEVVAAFGTHRAYDLRVFHGDTSGALALIHRLPFGRINGLGVLRRPDGGDVLLATHDADAPNAERFPTPPHLGAHPGVYLFEWTGSQLIERAHLPQPAEPTRTLARGVTIADLDGDARDEVALSLRIGPDMHTLLIRQADDGTLQPLVLGHGAPLLALQLDDDPARELLLAAGKDPPLSEEGGEALADLARLAAATPQEEGDQEDEDALVEIEEFVRVAVLLLLLLTNVIHTVSDMLVHSVTGLQELLTTQVQLKMREQTLKRLT